MHYTYKLLLICVYIYIYIIDIDICVDASHMSGRSRFGSIRFGSRFSKSHRFGSVRFGNFVFFRFDAVRPAAVERVMVPVWFDSVLCPVAASSVISRLGSAGLVWFLIPS